MAQVILLRGLNVADPAIAARRAAALDAKIVICQGRGADHYAR